MATSDTTRERAAAAAPHEPLWVVVGPTASGKSELALSLAERVRGEIVSADSVQVYRYFDIGTGKPSRSERERAPHHLIDIAEPYETLDAAGWATRAAACIAEIRARNRVPIVCGGSFLWVRALLYGLSPAPPASPELRARHRALVEQAGRAALHARLSEVDPESARRLAVNDFVRVSRALEVYELTQVPLSRFHAQHGFRERKFTARLIGVRRSKAELDERIHARALAMLNAGWLDEVSALLARGFADTRAMQSVGYKQVSAALAGDFDQSELALRVTRATRVFARRQRTWLRDEPVAYVDPEGRELDC